MYNKENNKIEIFFDKAKIAEADNKNQIEEEKCDNDRGEEKVNLNVPKLDISKLNINTDTHNITDPSLNLENSILYLKTDNTYNYDASSPVKPSHNKSKSRRFNYNTYFEEESAETKTESIHPSISLNKLFSNKSKSSKKSYHDNANKENNPDYACLNSNPSHKKILISNLSSAKKPIRNEFSKLDRGFNTATHVNTIQVINPFNFNGSVSKIDNCIKKTHLMNDNIRFVLSSNTNRHKKVISLDEAMGESMSMAMAMDMGETDCEATTIVRDERRGDESQRSQVDDSFFKMAKKLNFLSVSQSCFEINSIERVFEVKQEKEMKEQKKEKELIKKCEFNIQRNSLSYSPKIIPIKEEINECDKEVEENNFIIEKENEKEKDIAREDVYSFKESATHILDTNHYESLVLSSKM